MKRKPNKYIGYRKGGDGFIKWAEDNVWVSIYPVGREFSVWVPLGSEGNGNICSKTNESYHTMWVKVHPETGRSYSGMWKNQKAVLRQALEMNAGKFRYRLIIFCWPRGEGKSLLAVLLQLWKWFCWPRQDIKFCANSKDQTDHAHLSIAKEIILNSPNLLKIVGKKNILEHEIRRRNNYGHLVSKIEIITTSSGLFSNINGYAFSEIFELKNKIFWEKVDGNIRNIPNAFGVLDSTVSSKDHLLYTLYDGFMKGADPLTFFSYRCSAGLDYKDFWHPNQTQAQLDSYKAKQPLTYAKQFKNVWSAGGERIFSAEQVDAVNYIGAEGTVNHSRVIELIQRKSQIIDSKDNFSKDGARGLFVDHSMELEQIDSLLWSVDDVYQLALTHTGSVMASSNALDILGDMFDTEWAVIAGVDRAQPFKKRTGARTIYIVLAKGLPGSRSNPDIGIHIADDSSSDNVKGSEYMIRGPAYVYFYLHVADIIDHSLEGLKAEILMTHDEFGGIDSIGSESWGVFDMAAWAETLDIKTNLWVPTYARQLGAFTELFTLVDDGRIKSPTVFIPGARGDDILIEELRYFDHDEDIRWFGSPEKNARQGVQDDVMYASGWAIYGGRELTVHDFRPRIKNLFLGTIIQPDGLLGNYFVDIK